MFSFFFVSFVRPNSFSSSLISLMCCSIACGPATIVRNYFLNVPAHRGIATSRQRSDGGSSSALGQYVPNTHTHGKLKLDRLGQHKDRQINLADALMDEFVSGSNKMKVKNGYVFVESAADLQAISNQIHDRERRLLCESLLKVGVHEHTQVCTAPETSMPYTVHVR